MRNMDEILVDKINWTDRRGLAQHLKQSVRTVDNLRKQNIIPHVKIGRRVIFDIRAVDASIKRFEIKGV